MTHKVDVVHWNPRDTRLRGRIGQLISTAPRKNNFGDLLGPLVVGLLTKRLSHDVWERKDHQRRRLLSVGSIMHFARDGDTVWGTGVNGKAREKDHHFHSLDVRAVRGPKTREYLERLGVNVPAIYGDPGLLLPQLHPDLVRWSETKQHRLAVVPNLNDISKYHGHSEFVNPRAPVDWVLKRIAQSERVVASSLHGIVIAEAAGVPATLVRASEERRFKYDDYFQGTGRHTYPYFEDLVSALRSRPPETLLEWDPQPLVSAFPIDLWTSAKSGGQ